MPIHVREILYANLLSSAPVKQQIHHLDLKPSVYFKLLDNAYSKGDSQAALGPGCLCNRRQLADAPERVRGGIRGEILEIFSAQVGEAQINGPLVTDAALASLAVENGAKLRSTDRDFRRFKNLRLQDPLQHG